MCVFFPTGCSVLSYHPALLGGQFVRAMFLDRFLLRLIHYIISLVSCVNSWWQKALLRSVSLGTGGLLRRSGIILSWYYSSNNNNKGQTIKKVGSSGPPSSSSTLGQIRTDAKELTKLPLHIGLAVHESDFSYSDLCNVVIWSMAMGITYISVYEMHGDLKRNSTVLHNALLKKKQELLGAEGNAYEIYLAPGPPQHTGSTNKQITVNIMSLDDGRQTLVQTAQHLCEQVLQRQTKVEDIDYSLIDKFYQAKYGCPDPDLIVKFGKIDSLLGFSPWQAQFSEILCFPTHMDLDYKSYLGLLVSYANSQQRCGK